jgi:hypothetical protein
MADSVDHQLLALPRGDRGELRLFRSQFEGHNFTKLHLYYPAGDGELKPGRQVVTIRDHELADVIGALQRIARRVGEATPQSPQPHPRAAGHRREHPPVPTAAQAEAQQAQDERLF